jgi:lysozyme
MPPSGPPTAIQAVPLPPAEAPATPTAAVTASTTPAPSLSGPAAALQGLAEVKGIDISHWQGQIDWGKVRAADVRVAYIKASEGKDYVDPTYARNRTDSAAAGVVTGAYDFARPGSRNPGDVVADAKAEAEHFLATANIKPGDLAPVLDLEDAGSLNPDQLSQWATTWSDTVQAATGVKPLLYTSPSFFEDKIGNKDAVADKFRLWLAHWNTDTPRVPSQWQAWQGWQTGIGKVDGIAGDVDLDRFRNPAELVIPG